MPKWAKTFIAILLLPFCFGALSALKKVATAAGPADTVWMAVAAGAACWWTIYLLLPKPMRMYVFGHEFTHAVWTWTFGGQVKRFKVGVEGGHVIVTKSNFLIALAPYFFPLYAMLVTGSFWAGHLVWGWAAYMVYFHFLFGAAYAFHVTLTWHVLQGEQSDITGQGYIFSSVVIFLGNAIVLLVTIPLLSGRASLFQTFSWWFTDSMSCGRQILGFCSRLLRAYGRGAV